MKKNGLSRCQQELLDFLGEQYTVAHIDHLDCIYRDFGDYDVEICGGRTIRAPFQVYVWQKRPSLHTVHCFPNLPHDLSQVAELLQLIALQYGTHHKEENEHE